MLRHRLPAALAAAAVPALLAGALTACSSAAVHTQPVAAATTVPAARATVPPGWIVRRGPGFTVALPPTWTPRPDGQRAAPAAALEIGVPFTGQSTPPPLLTGFVERDRVGPLDVREQVLRAQLSAALPGATIGTSRHLGIAGSTDAVTFDVVDPDDGGTSVLGTRLEACVIRQRELIVETSGLPKYGFRYAATTAEFDEQLWRQVAGSVVVTAGASGAGATGG